MNVQAHDNWTQTLEGRLEVLQDTRSTLLRRLCEIEDTTYGPTCEYFALRERVEDIEDELCELGFHAKHKPLLDNEIPF